MWLPDVMTSTPAPNSASAVETVSPMPPATFSPFAVTKSIPRSSWMPDSACSTATRPGLPMMSPIMSTRHAPGGLGASPFGGLPRPARSLRPITMPSAPRPVLLRVLDGPRLADDGDLDLARVRQVVLDLLHDVAGEPRRREVVDLLGPDEDADLASRLDGERALDAREALRDPLQVLEALDVRLHRLAACSWPRGADRVGDLDDRRLDAGELDLLVVGRDPVHDLERHVVLLGDARADAGVRPLDFVVDGLADVVEQAADLGSLDVGAQLGRDDRGDVARLDRVHEDVLAVRRAVLQPPEQLEQVRRQARDPRVVGCLVTGLADDEVDLRARLRDDLLDAAGVDPAVGDELRDRDPRDLPPDGVEPGEDDGLRRVVDDQVDAGRLLERADVAALAADDPALHLVARQVDDAHRVLRGVVRGDPLHRRDDDLARLLLRLVARPALDRPCDLHGVVLGFLADRLEQDALRVLGRQPRDLLQRGNPLLAQLRERLALALEVPLAIVDLAALVLEHVRALVELLVARQETPLEVLELRALLAGLLVGLALLAQLLALRLEDHVLLLRPRLGDDARGLVLGGLDRLARQDAAGDEPRDHADDRGDQRRDYDDRFHLQFLPSGGVDAPEVFGRIGSRATRRRECVGSGAEGLGGSLRSHPVLRLARRRPARSASGCRRSLLRRATSRIGSRRDVRAPRRRAHRVPCGDATPRAHAGGPRS